MSFIASHEGKNIFTGLIIIYLFLSIAHLGINSNNSSAFIHHFCTVLKNEYAGEINQKKEIQDLNTVFFKLSPMMMRCSTGDKPKSTFEFRSSLTKKIFFKRTETLGIFLTEYDGENHDLFAKVL